MVVDYFNPNQGYQEYYLAKEWAKAGHDVFVITSNVFSPGHYKSQAISNAERALGRRERKEGEEEIDGFKIIRLKRKFEILRRPWVSSLEKTLKIIKPDIVNVDGITNFSAVRCAKLKKHLKYKLIYDDHMYWGNSKSKLRVLYPLFKRTIGIYMENCADKIIAICEDTKVFMIKNYGFLENNIVVVPLAADEELFKREPEWRMKLRTELDIKESDVVYIYSGKIFPNKGIHLLIEAALSLMDKYNNVKIIVVGYGPNEYIKNMKEKILKSRHENKFSWLEWMNPKELYKIYSAADIAVWPKEATNSIEEAMACCLPPILPSTLKKVKSAAAEIGITYKDGDVRALTDAMETLLINKGIREEMAMNARSLIEGHLNWAKISRIFLE